MKAPMINDPHTQVNENQIKAIRKVIACYKGIAAMYPQGKLEKMTDLLNNLSFRLQKQDIGFGPKYLTKRDLEKLQEAIILIHPFVEKGYLEKKLTQSFKLEWE